MNIGVPSRFACLKIEDEPNSSAKSKEKKVDPKKSSRKEPETKKSKKEVPNKLSNSKPKNLKEKTNTNKKSKKKEKAEEQWEEWIEKDNQLVNGHYEEDLQNAILLSKLDYEEKKDLYKQMEKESELEKNRGQVKKKKSKVMTLDQFLVSGSNENAENHPEKLSSSSPPDESFFDRIEEETHNELNREEVKELRKKREEKIDQIISLAQLQDKLDRERKEKEELRKELEKAKTEITSVKERNKLLCSILGQGEMKDKADVLVELEKLNSIKNELTEELVRLNGLLEQERSKVAALTEAQNNKSKRSKK